MEQQAVTGQCDLHCPLCNARKAAEAIKGHLRHWVPEEFWQHRSAARRETLLALRSLVDAALAHEPATSPRKPTRIKVE